MLYFDHSATTPLHPDVLDLMHLIAKENFGNPSSVHPLGQRSRAIIETARRQMSSAIGAKPFDIIFTGGGTEANNIVLWSLIQQKKKHVIISSIEHPAIYQTLHFLRNFGVETTEVPVSSSGVVNVLDVENAIREDTALVSIMLANNEVGSIQPLKEISSICKDKNILLHTDAVQALGKIPINVNEIGADFMSFSAHKFYGPKGVGALYLRSASNLKALIHGGGQERKLRAGTENVPGIAGLGLAAELSAKKQVETQKHLNMLAEHFRQSIEKDYPSAVFNCEPDLALPGLVSVSLPDAKSDIMMIHLGRAGMAVSSGSACSSGTISPSHVLKAMGVSNNMNINTLRISFGKDNTLENVDSLVNAILESRQKISRISR